MRLTATWDSPWRSGLGRATTAIAAAGASFCTVYALCRALHAGPEPAIAAVVLAITLSRREGPATAAHAALAPFIITGVALVAAGVGWLLRTIPAAGAAVFTAAMFLSIWLRNFGAGARAAGALIALPLIAMLVVPVGPGTAPGGPPQETLLIVCAGLVALGYVLAVKAIAKALGGKPAAVERPEARKAEPARRAGLPVPTRMALQMTVALAASFAFGFAIFPGHWAWTVLTAFIVCSGSVGRGDAAYRGAQRLAGAVAGTLGAAALTHVWTPRGVPEAMTLFGLLFAGLWLREVDYAYWACCMTLVLAILWNSNAGLDGGVLYLRLEAILAGALCAVAATWFVFPIHTEAVIRRRLADALRAFDELVANAHLRDAEQAQRVALFERRLSELDRAAPPVRWHSRLFARYLVPEHPARWVELAATLRPHARTIGEQGGPHERHRAAIRRAIGASRRAVADHGKADAPQGGLGIGGALNELREVLTGASSPRR